MDGGTVVIYIWTAVALIVATLVGAAGWTYWQEMRR